MTGARTLDAIVDDAAFLSYEHQLHLGDLAEQLGEHDWRVDLGVGELYLTGQRTLRTTAHLLGTTSDSAGSWLWGWANPSGFPPQVTELSERVAEFGRRQGVAELADKELPLSPDIAARLLDAAKVVTGHWTGYSGQAGPGTRAYFLIDAPELTLGEPRVPRFLRVVGESMGTGMVRDHRRALASYARLRGLAAAAGPGGASWRMWLPDGEVTVSFDEHGRVGNMSFQAGPPSA